MRRRNLILFFIASTIVIVTACTKGGTPADDGNGGGPHVENPTDSTAPVIQIITPTANQSFANGSTISTTGRITDDYGLYRGVIKITNDANGAVVKEQAYEIHGSTGYNFNMSHVVAVAAASDYTVTVSFEDHGNNSTTLSVKIKVTP
jgi:hypothetical protein